jgi:leucine dehydrogenase
VSAGPRSAPPPAGPGAGGDLSARLEAGGHEQVTVFRDPAAGLTGVIAIHDTTLGPAVGGTRLWRYPTFDAALEDALRLSRAMTVKNALAGLPFGGGKAVLLAPTPGGPPAGPAREAFLLAYGRFLDRLGGTFITGEDVGTAPEDLQVVRRVTRHVAGLPEGHGDPSPHTARGVLRAMEAAAAEAWGASSLQDRTVAIQGVGHVGRHLAHLLREAGARVIVADLDPARAADVARATGAEVVPPEAILETPCDVLAPCALGGVLDERSIARLACTVIVGAANDQLATPDDAERLRERSVLHVPDTVASAGGVLSGGVDLLGWTPAQATERIDAIADTTRRVLAYAREHGLTPHAAAQDLAAQRIRAARRTD